ncbi:MAG: helix-turn-helix transcriptional regulator [bacterium]
MNFNANFERILQERNIKKSELAKELELDRTTIYKYANGEVLPSLEVVEKLTIIFNCSYDELLK